MAIIKGLPVVQLNIRIQSQGGVFGTSYGETTLTLPIEPDEKVEDLAADVERATRLAVSALLTQPTIARDVADRINEALAATPTVREGA